MKRPGASKAPIRRSTRPRIRRDLEVVALVPHRVQEGHVAGKAHIVMGGAGADGPRRSGHEGPPTAAAGRRRAPPRAGLRRQDAPLLVLQRDARHAFAWRAQVRDAQRGRRCFRRDEGWASPPPPGRSPDGSAAPQGSRDCPSDPRRAGRARRARPAPARVGRTSAKVSQGTGRDGEGGLSGDAHIMAAGDGVHSTWNSWNGSAKVWRRSRRAALRRAEAHGDGVALLQIALHHLDHERPVEGADIELVIVAGIQNRAVAGETLT